MFESLGTPSFFHITKICILGTLETLIYVFADLHYYHFLYLPIGWELQYIVISYNNQAPDDHVFSRVLNQKSCLCKDNIVIGMNLET